MSEPAGDGRRPPIRILLADDHGVVRAGLRALLEAQADMRVVAEAADGPSAVELTRRHVPTVVVADLSMPGGGLETIREITSLGLPTRVLVLTVHAEERYLLPVLRMGGSGYVHKGGADTDLLDAIRTVARGDVFLYPGATRLLLADYLDREDAGRGGADRGRDLSDRERQVLALTAEGYSAQEIGERLFLSPKTIETYRERAMHKLGLRRRADLVQYALRSGLLRTPDDTPPPGE